MFFFVASKGPRCILCNKVLGNGDEVCGPCLSGKNSEATKTETATRTAKRQQVLIGKTTTLHVHHAFFVYFFAVSARLQRELPNFPFYGGREHYTTIFFFLFVNLDTVL